MKQRTLTSKQQKTRRALPAPGIAASRREPLKLNTILVPVDFTACSSEALEYAIWLSGRIGGDIVILNVVDFYMADALDPRFDYARVSEDLCRNALAKLRGIEKRLARGTNIRTMLRQGRAWKVICETAREQNADLIVIGTRGASGLKRVFLGSTAEHVVRYAHCAVLVVPGRLK